MSMPLARGLILALVWSSSAGAEPCLRGVNLSGAEFGAMPGRPGTDYAYPAADAFAWVAGQGMTAIRLPFRWERIQPKPGEALDEAELGRLDAAVKAAAAAGLTTILDLHDFGHYHDAKIGSAAVPNAAFTDVWTRLAQHFRERRDVVFSLMNEPYDIGAAEWASITNAAVAAIRKTGAKQLLLVSGTAYAGAHSWESDLSTGNNAREMGVVKDPLGRIAFDFHQYLDADFSGRSAECPKAAESEASIDRVSAWLERNNARGFLGEFAASAKPECLAALGRLTARVNADPAHWIGWTAWGAGAWWPADYIFNLQPTAAGERPQMKVLASLAREPSRCNLAARP